MVSITGVLLAAACVRDEGPKDRRPHDSADGSPCVPGPPLPPLEPVVRLFPEDRGDWAGRDLDVFDHDCDGRVDVLVASDWSANPAFGVNDDPEGWGVYLLRHPVAGGALRDQAWVTWRGLGTGDVDGDGHADVLAGAPLGDGGAFVFFGPFAGDRTTAAADVSVAGAAPGEWLGYAVTAGDLTADGGTDLAVGAPWSIYDDGAPPGAVLVFDDPRGALDVSEATSAARVGRRGARRVRHRDGFGDLVIGAPRDPTVARDAGSVTIVSGAGL